MNNVSGASPQALTGPEGDAALQQLMARCPLLAFDLDGTLAPIVSRPGDARVPQALAHRLARLARLRPVVVVTGRRVADARGNEVPRGEVGELLVRGPTVMRGYWDDPIANADAMRDGWLHTGDLGWIGAGGLIYVADRAKDMVISAGNNIYCAEVERVLSMLHDQHEVALFGVPDARLGERAIAAVTMKDEAKGALDEAAVKAHVRAHLADYKVPAEVRFDLGPFHRNDLGKINKAQLAVRYSELAAASAA